MFSSPINHFLDDFSEAFTIRSRFIFDENRTFVIYGSLNKFIHFHIL